MTDESFLSRWSRLKRTQASESEPLKPDTAPPPAVSDAGPPSAEPPAAPADDSAEVAKDLPPLDSLTAESDFTPFLRAGVPEDLHRQALRKLWASDPIYANDDGLKDYAGDYTGLFDGRAVKTLYRVGKGFLDAAEEMAEKTPEGADEAAAAAPVNGDADEVETTPEESSNPEGGMINKS